MRRSALCLVIVFLAAVVIPVVIGPTHLQAQADRRCFAETRFCIEGRIRGFWEQNGGLPVFGLPISPQQAEELDGQVIQAQWFERNRLELHPANKRPYDVLIGRFGADRLHQLGVDWTQIPRTDPQDGCRWFAETGHAICGEFLQAWRASGLEFDGRRGTSEAESLALFGLPLSDARTETIAGSAYTVQWFERARFELHLENQPPYRVLLGLLGSEIGAPLQQLFAQVGSGEVFTFVNQPGTFETMVSGSPECRRSGQRGLRVTYSFSGAGNGGWGVSWHNAPGARFDGAPYDTLTFWVRGTAPSGFQIGLRDAGEREIKQESRDVVTVDPGEWRRLSIPLSQFADDRGPVRPEQIRNVNIGFNATHGSGSICIADIAFEAQLADIFPQIAGGQPFAYTNPPGTLSAQLVDDPACRESGQYGLQIDYQFSGNGFGGWGVQWSDSARGSFDGSPYSVLVFWFKGSAPSGFQIGLKDTSEYEVKIDAGTVLRSPAGDWQRVTIPLARFTQNGRPVNTALLRNLNLGFNTTHGAGRICIDQIGFE